LLNTSTLFNNVSSLLLPPSLPLHAFEPLSFTLFQKLPLPSLAHLNFRERSNLNNYRHIVETPDLEELCQDCKQEIERKRRWEEAERERKLKWEEAEKVREQQRKEARRVYAKEYRKRLKERKCVDAERKALGLTPLETEKKSESVDTIINHHGHQFQRRNDEQGRSEVFCLRCEATWSRPPQVYCAGIKTYRAWVFIPDHLMTRTQLRKAGLKPAKEQKPKAVIVGSYDSYSLYDKDRCVPIKRKLRSNVESAGK
jgi:hypothetical protein